MTTCIDADFSVLCKDVALVPGAEPWTFRAEYALRLDGHPEVVELWAQDAEGAWRLITPALAPCSWAAIGAWLRGGKGRERVDAAFGEGKVRANW